MAEDNALTIWRPPSHMQEERPRGTSKEGASVEKGQHNLCQADCFGMDDRAPTIGILSF